jgi:lipopolysaccharide/colanic/teichoic acid biosynthesis glycosyltransferase
MSDDVTPPEQGESRDDFVTRIIDQLVDLLQTARDWVQQEAEATVRTRIVPPLQKLGLAVASAFAAATLLVIGLIFVAVAAMVYLSQLLGVPLAFLIVGGIYLIGAAIFTIVKVRSMQREQE